MNFPSSPLVGDIYTLNGRSWQYNADGQWDRMAGSGGGSLSDLTVSSGRILGRIAAGTGAVQQLTTAQATGMLDLASDLNKGLMSASDFTKLASLSPGGGSGSVTNLSIVAANGISGSVANSTSTPAITLTLGSITPASVTATGSVTGSNLSGTNTGDQTITLTGDVTGAGTGTFATSIGTNKVTNAMLAAVATGSFLGRTTAGTGNIETLTSSQATQLLTAFTTTTKGLVPSPGTYGRKVLCDDASWIAGPGMFRGDYDTIVGSINFETQTVPPGWTYGGTGTGFIYKTEPDATISTTYALTFDGPGADDQMGDNVDAWFEFTVNAGASSALKVRHKTQGETNYDGIYIKVDGVQQYFNAPGINQGYIEASVTIPAGTHVIRVGFKSDSSVSGGYSNTRISQITLPLADIFRYGDIVSKSSKYYLCVTTGTNGIPGSSADWILLPGSAIPLGWNGGITGKPANGALIMLGIAPAAMTLTQASCYAESFLSATASTTITIKKKPPGGIASTVGTLVWAAGGFVATVTITSATIANGDVVYLEAPGTADANLGNIAYIIR